MRFSILGVRVLLCGAGLFVSADRWEVCIKPQWAFQTIDESGWCSRCFGPILTGVVSRAV